MAYDGGSTDPADPVIREIAEAKLGIRASCSCGHARVLDPHRVCVPPSTEVSKIGDLLTCSVCRTKGMVTMVAPLA
jgi:hypothetical protein